MQFGDFDGDGRKDIFFPTSYSVGGWAPEAKYRAFIWNGDDFEGQDIQIYPNLGPDTQGHRNSLSGFRLGDLNGDHRTDVFGLVSNGSRISIFYSEGNDITNVYALANILGEPNSIFSAGDINGDGRTDLLAFDGSCNGTTWLPNMGIGAFTQFTLLSFSMCPIDTWLPDFNGDGRNEIEIISDGENGRRGDINGDGKTDIWSISFIEPKIGIAIQSEGTPDLLTDISQGLSKNTTITYKPAPQVPGAVMANLTSYPGIANSAPRNLVTQVATNDGRGATYTKHYHYHNGRIQNGFINQRRDRGFQWVREVDGQTGAYTQTWYNHDDPDKAFVVKRTETFAGGSFPAATADANYALLMSRVENDHEIVGTGGDSFTVRLNSQITRTYDHGSLISSKTQTFTSGNDTIFALWFPKYITDQADGTDTIVTEIGYAPPDMTNWIGNRVVSTIMRRASASGPILNQTQFIYDGSCGNVHNMCKRNDWLNIPTAKWLTTGYEYDSYGNVIRTTDPMGRSTEIEYDILYHALPIRMRNALSHEVSTSYDFRFGTWLTQTDANGQVTERVLDEFGRPVELRVNGSLVSTILYHDELLGNPNAQHIETRTVDAAAPLGYTFSKVFFDGLGRTYKTEASGPNLNGTFHTIVTETGFDSAGRKAAESQPYLAPRDLPVFTSYEYDTAGRINFIYYPEGSYSEIVYDADYGGKQTITDEYDANGNIKISVRDSRGRLVGTVEGGLAIVRNEYDALGQLSRVIDADGNIISIYYDSLGRKISMIEPNTGVWSYAYDDAGNLVEQTDPKNQKITFQYDALDRLTDKILPAGGTNVHYGYDNVLVNGKGLLTSINDAAGLTEYSYDNRGNMSGWRQTIAGKTYSFQTSYDLQNRLTRLTYPDGEYTENYYAESGYLRQVRLKNPDKVWGAPVVTYSGPEQTGDANVLQLTRIAGNNVTTQIGFDRRTHKAVSLQTRLADASHTLVEDVEFEPDAVGNIVSMTDNLNANRTQTFGYDSLYRLTNAQSAAYGNLTYSYSPGGNLLNKTGMAYSYGNPQHPQAVTQAGAHSFTYDANANMLKRNIAAQPSQDLVYDAEDRLTQIAVAGVTKHSFTYDHTGQRVMKQREDGTTVTYLSGLYEVLRLPDASERHTKYIYGIAGERVAQITRDGASVSVAMQDIHNQNLLALSSFHSGTLGTFLNVYYGTQYLFANTRVMKRVLLLAFFLATLALVFQTLRSRLRKEYNVYAESHPAMASVAPMVLAFALFEFGFLGCAGSSTTIENATPWSDLPPSPPGSPDDVSNGSLSDTTQRGFPVLGAYFMHPNHVGSPALITNAAGTQALTQITYKPYGEVVRNNAYSHGADITRYKFTGQEEDAETGLIYMNSRYYDPAIARFITSDSEFGGQGTQGFNRHMYATGNPIKYSDPSGHSSEDQAEKYDLSKADEKGNVPERSRSESGWEREERGGRSEASGVESARESYGESSAREHVDVDRGDRGDRGAVGASNAVDNSQLTSIVQAVTMTQFTAALPGAQASAVPVTRSPDGRQYTQAEITDLANANHGNDSGSNLPTYAKAAGVTVAIVAVIILAVKLKNLGAARATAGQMGQNVAQVVGGNNGTKGINVIKSITLSGGRSGQNVRNLTGPPNSVIRGAGGRAFATNQQGQVILDITQTRVKPVIPGQGFGNKRAPTMEELKWLDELWK